jgi:endonuclease IV
MDLTRVGANIRGVDVAGQVNAIKAITGVIPSCFQIFTHDTDDHVHNLPDEGGVTELIKTSRCYIHSTFGVSLAHSYTDKRFIDQYKVASVMKATGIILHIPNYEILGGAQKKIAKKTDMAMETQMYQTARRYFALAAKVTGHHPVIYFEHVMSRHCAKPRHLIKLVARMKEIASSYSAELRVGICIDTCHLYASGQSITSEAEAGDYFGHYKGCDLPILIHLNDSVGEFDSLIDRHAELGSKIWLEDDGGLRHIVGLGYDCIIELKDTLPSYKKLVTMISE